MPAESSSAVRSQLRDFNADSRMIILSALALVLGLAGAVLAYFLLHLIYAATNLFYFHRFGWQFVSPAANHLHWLAVFVPIVGGILIGLMARYGSDKIRGHGMPEAIEAILIHGAKVDARVAFFKPLSAAIAIGSGGPFGAEGPIIMTAGSVGSLFAQMFRLSDAERSTLLVAGAAAGMAGVFSTPLAAILLAVELLLFEWRPRSLVPVAVAATTAGALRRFFLGPGPLFPMPAIAGSLGPRSVIAALAVGVIAGALALLLSRAVYASEDLFENHLPVHWMWWPAIGGLVIGVGGLIFPRALGTGYDVIASLIGGDTTWHLILGVLDREEHYLVLLPRVGNIGRNSCAAADDRRRAGCAAYAGAAGAGDRRMGAGGHGGCAFGRDWLSADRNGAGHGTDPQLQPDSALACGFVRCTRPYGAAATEVDPDGETEPQRASPEPRIFGGSAGSDDGVAGDVDERGRCCGYVGWRRRSRCTGGAARRDAALGS